jgi:pimeloyl-ACP methyl ester carboxylesterase
MLGASCNVRARFPELSRVPPPRFEGSIRIERDRQLGYAEFGPVTGRPLIWFHGTPGARRQISPEARVAADQRNVRIISVERPGVGDSTPHVYDSVSELAHDIRSLAEALGLDHFGLAALSGGGPYALACAHEMPERVVAVAVLGGVAPSVGADAAKGGGSSLAPLFSPFLRHARTPLDLMLRSTIRVLEPLADHFTDLFSSIMPPGDQRVFEDDGIRQMFQEDLLLGSRTHMQAIFLDAALFGREWGFALGDIRVPVHLFYGDSDSIVPVEHGEHLAKRMPHSVLRIRAEEGHLGGLGASEEIFDAILGHWPGDGSTPG